MLREAEARRRRTGKGERGSLRKGWLWLWRDRSWGRKRDRRCPWLGWGTYREKKTGVPQDRYRGSGAESGIGTQQPSHLCRTCPATPLGLAWRLRAHCSCTLQSSPAPGDARARALSPNSCFLSPNTSFCARGSVGPSNPSLPCSVHSRCSVCTHPPPPRLLASALTWIPSGESWQETGSGRKEPGDPAPGLAVPL